MSTILVDRQSIVDTARSYIGTRFLHQGRMRGGGVDCAGLLMCVAYDLRLRDVQISGYGRQPNEDEFRAALREHLVPIGYTDILPGDVLTFAVPIEQHIAIVSRINPIWIIHAYEKVGRVVDQELDATWLRRLRGCYRLREAAPMVMD